MGKRCWSVSTFYTKIIRFSACDQVILLSTSSSDQAGSCLHLLLLHNPGSQLYFGPQKVNETFNLSVNVTLVCQYLGEKCFSISYYPISKSLPFIWTCGKVCKKRFWCVVLNGVLCVIFPACHSELVWKLRRCLNELPQSHNESTLIYLSPCSARSCCQQRWKAAPQISSRSMFLVTA